MCIRDRLDNGAIELWGGPAQAQGQGSVLGTGQVRIPLTADIDVYKRQLYHSVCHRVREMLL